MLDLFGVAKNLSLSSHRYTTCKIQGKNGSTADKVARRATYPTLEHDYFDPGPLAERIRRDKRERSDRSSDDSSSDQDSCGSGSTSEANDIFDTLDDHLGYGSDSGFGW